ncbi:cytochrome c3 family protein [bacterium]|nr:cytochrome c3 family protein [bacterium]
MNASTIRQLFGIACLLMLVSAARVYAVDKPTEAVDPGGCVTTECHGEVEDYAVLHGPVGGLTCDACHEVVSVEEHTFRLWREGEKLCTYCHEFDTGLLPVVHYPVTAGECLGCHNPHGGPDHALSREETMADTCGRCHESVSYGKEFMHDPIMKGECTNCHRPHASRFPMLLDIVGDDLCLACHKDFGKDMQQIKFRHEALDEGCEACHDVHASNYPSGLSLSIADGCLQCHEDVRESTLADVKHPSVVDERACLSCHTAHGGDLDALMRDEPVRVCMDCHDEKIEKDGVELMTAMVRINDPSRFKHTPVAEGECGGCHTIHGGDQVALLQSAYSTDFHQQFSPENYDLCFECHDERLVQEENVGDLTGFRNGERNLHFVHVAEGEDFARNCRVCHGVHTSTYPMLIRDKVPYGNWMMPIRFEKTETGGTCMTGCHTDYAYDREHPVDSTTLIAADSPRLPRADKDEPVLAMFTGMNLDGEVVEVPDGNRPSIIMFLRGGQPQSQQMMETVAAESSALQPAQIVAIFSGETAGEQAEPYAGTSSAPWPILIDPEYHLSSMLGVEVWPAAFIVQSDGVQIAHIGGAPLSLAVSLESYIQLARGEIDREAVRQRLASNQVIGDGSAKSAIWHLQMGGKLLDEGKPEEARAMFAKGLELDPESVDLKVKMISTLAELKNAKDAINLLDRLPEDALPEWQTNLLRGQVMAAVGQWDEARRLAVEVLKQRPNLGDAHYLMGMVYEQNKQFELAAEEYRAAIKAGGR